MGQAAIVQFGTTEQDLTPTYGRIRTTSRVLSLLFSALLVAFGLFATALTFAFLAPFGDQLLGIGPKGLLIHFGDAPLPKPYVAVGALPLAQRLAHLPVGLINFGPVVVILWSLRRLFGLYAAGVVFARENARHIKWIGAALGVHAVAPFLGVSFLRALDFVIDQNWMHGSSLQELLLGAVVYVIAQVMQVGREIEEERSQFV